MNSQDRARHPVVVGVDGSPYARQALDWAIAEAVGTNRPLRVVHAFVWSLLGVPDRPTKTAPHGGLRADAQQLLDAALAHARSTAPGVEVTGAFPTATAAGALVEESANAAMVVVGARGLGAVGRLLLGSTSDQVAAHARCPVVVVGQEQGGTGGVVVGVDGSPSSAGTLAFAATEAARLGVALTATMVVPSLIPGDHEVQVRDEHDAPLHAAQLAAATEPLHTEFPDVPVHLSLLGGHPGRVLTQTAADARLLVVGARGHGGFTALPLGGTGRYALHHAHCPTAVVREVW
ncbi:universal stress protein [Actinokineospora sp. PR83]|uniref:universal stress protein n=1 Tax=Actinokineospora sp. PR83 TaxID=2884908 RepID=UPI001F3D7F16|nr:universal stress protein [Actinokineospora sp. PR83]MCG8915546.1 universal stress protein [Actinokineospora sp. PR83]